jgi:hypothetical protein
LVPFVSKFRNCSFEQTRWVSATGFGSGDADRDEPGSRTADVRLATAEPNTRYTVRLIRCPSRRIGPAPLETGGGRWRALYRRKRTATTTVQGPLVQGATGAWVCRRTAKSGRVIGEFYTSESSPPLLV